MCYDDLDRPHLPEGSIEHGYSTELLGVAGADHNHRLENLLEVSFGFGCESEVHEDLVKPKGAVNAIRGLVLNLGQMLGRQDDHLVADSEFLPVLLEVKPVLFLEEDHKVARLVRGASAVEQTLRF